MNGQPETRRSAGETIESLCRALGFFRTGKQRRGFVRMRASIPFELGVVLQRAVMRIEAEFLQHDADSLTADNVGDLRSDYRRRADALVALTRRLAEVDQ